MDKNRLTNDRNEGSRSDASGNGKVEETRNPKKSAYPALAVVDGVYSPCNNGFITRQHSVGGQRGCANR